MEPLLKSKEINLCQVTLKEELGKGEFGVVYKGVITGVIGYPDNMAVAVKTTKGILHFPYNVYLVVLKQR